MLNSEELQLPFPNVSSPLHQYLGGREYSQQLAERETILIREIFSLVQQIQNCHG